MGFVESNYIIRRGGKGIGRQEGVEHSLLRDESFAVEESGVISKQDPTGITAGSAD